MEMTLLRPKPAPPTPLGRWLKRTGYTVTELADAVGVNKGTISRVVSGKAPASERLAQKIKKATGLRQI